MDPKDTKSTPVQSSDQNDHKKEEVGAKVMGDKSQDQKKEEQYQEEHNKEADKVGKF